MLKIKAIRATIGNRVSAKVKNAKDDAECVVEFGLLNIPLTTSQLSDLVACHPDERDFAAVAFVSVDALSELRHFRSLELKAEIRDATLQFSRIGASGSKLKLDRCQLKKISLNFAAEQGVAMSCTVWCRLEEHSQYLLGESASQEVVVGITSKQHGEIEEDAQGDILRDGDD